MDDRSKSVVYLSKEPGIKENRLYDPVTGSLHISRDVVFQEDKTWPWEQLTTSEVSFPKVLTVVGSITDKTKTEVVTPQQSSVSSIL